MRASRLLPVVAAVLYAAVPVTAYVLLRGEDVSLGAVAIDVALSAVPMALLGAVTWRLVWPKWKLVAKVLLHPCLYAIAAVYLGHWSVLLAWVHQGLFGLGVHVWFSRKHGFTWYAVEDPDRYVSLSKQMAGVVSDRGGKKDEAIHGA